MVKDFKELKNHRKNETENKGSLNLQSKKENISKYPLTIGFIFTIITLGFILITPCPTGSQYIFFRIVLSISVASFAAVIPGFIEIRYRNLITAGGALGVMVLIYLFNPASLFINDDCFFTRIRGIVTINGSPEEGIKVRNLEAEIERTTNRFGIFEMTISTRKIGKVKWTPLSRQKSIKVKLVYIHMMWETRNGKTKPCGKPIKTFIHTGFCPVENLWKTCG